MIEFFKNGLTDFVFKENLSSLPTIIKRALQDIKKNKKNEASNSKEQFRIQEL